MVEKIKDKWMGFWFWFDRGEFKWFNLYMILYVAFIVLCSGTYVYVCILLNKNLI